MSGLPGSGKSTVAEQLATDLGCAVISVDTIERSLHEVGVDASQPIGLAAYAVANRLVDVQLGLGHTVIADAVNHHPDARQAWIDLATKHGAEIRIVHVECSDETLHRERLATRKHELRVVPWERVVELKKTWTPWPIETESINTAHAPRHEHVTTITA